MRFERQGNRPSRDSTYAEDWRGACQGFPYEGEKGQLPLPGAVPKSDILASSRGCHEPGVDEVHLTQRSMRQLSYALVLGLILAGCQSKQMPAAAPQPPASVTIRASDFAFDAPAEIPAGVTTFHLVNDGPGLHHALIVRLDSGKTVADLVASLHTQGAMPAWARYVGGPNVPDSGKESIATLDLEPGNYAMLCILDMPGGVPHYTRGMSRALTVTAAAATTSATPKAVAPTPDNAIVLSDMVFALNKPITAGTHTFQVTTAPGQPHEVLVVQLDPGKTGQDYVNWAQSMKGPAPGHAIGGTAAAATGVVQVFTATFVPGDYLLICLVPDVKTGKPHFVEGMMQTVRVS